MITAVIVALDPILLVDHSESHLVAEEGCQALFTGVEFTFVRKRRVTDHVVVADVAVVHLLF